MEVRTLSELATFSCYEAAAQRSLMQHVLAQQQTAEKGGGSKLRSINDGAAFGELGDNQAFQTHFQ
jgi:hypothetical protein